jgi:uncharacterized protein with GYD domain
MNWTDQGVRADKETVHRRDQADALAEKHGARIEQVYWTMGHYDIVTIIEAPDDETATAMMLELHFGAFACLFLQQATGISARVHNTL